MPLGIFLSTLSLRRATRRPPPCRRSRAISIHALLAESDHETYVIMEATKVISIHALLAESDRYRDAEQVTFWQFLSTLSLRRATSTNEILRYLLDISIHALLAESDQTVSGNYNMVADISIHALLAESDGAAVFPKKYFIHFYPRSPCGERRQAKTRRT